MTTDCPFDKPFYFILIACCSYGFEYPITMRFVDDLNADASGSIVLLTNKHEAII